MSLCLIAKLQDWRQEDLCLPRRGGCETFNLIHILMFQSKNLSIWKTSFDFDPLLVLGAGWHSVDTWLPKNVSNGWTGGDSIVGERRKTTLWEWTWNCHHRISADWPGLPGNIDTAITWKDTGATYIFKVISENCDYGNVDDSEKIVATTTGYFCRATNIGSSSTNRWRWGEKMTPVLNRSWMQALNPNLIDEMYSQSQASQKL